MAKLGPFALTGQGLGDRAKKSGVAFGGPANADDQKNAVNFQSGKTLTSKAALSNPRLDQKPAVTSFSRKGVTGSPLPLGSQASGSTVSGSLKSARKGSSGSLPLGQGGPTPAVAPRLK